MAKTERRETKHNDSVKMLAIKGFAKWLWYRDKLTETIHKVFDEYYPDLPKNKNTRRALKPQEEKLILKKLGNQMFRMMFWVGVNYSLRYSEFSSFLNLV